MKPSLFAGHRSFDGISFAVNTCIRNILCCDGGNTTELAKEEFGFNIHSLENIHHKSEAWTSAHIDRLVGDLWPSLDKKITSQPVVSYSSSAALEALHACNAAGPLLFNAARLKRFFDNKSISKRIFRSLGLAVPASLSLHYSREAMANAACILGYPFVLRKLYASTGAGTFLVKDTVDYETLLARGVSENERVIAETFIDGMPININAAISHGQIFIYEPSIQLIGIPESTDMDFGYCGNDYVTARQLPTEIIAECMRQAKLAGTSLLKSGYKGIYGMDMIVCKDGTVFPCEINPRFQNSTALLNWSYKGSDCSPAQLHLNAYTHSGAARLQNAERAFSQIILHATKEDEGSTVAGTLAEGRYVMKDGRCRFIEATLNPLHLREGEILISGAPPRQGTKICNNASLFKIISTGAITENGFQIASQPLRTALIDLKAQMQLTR